MVLAAVVVVVRDSYCYYCCYCYDENDDENDDDDGDDDEAVYDVSDDLCRPPSIECCLVHFVVVVVRAVAVRSIHHRLCDELSQQ